MKVLLCLLSGQPTPNLLSLHHVRPDALVLIETLDMKRSRAAQNFLAAAAAGGLEYGERCSVRELESEDDLATIRRTLLAAHATYPSAEWVVNLTGGNKPMSLGAYDVFRGLGARFLYTNVARPSTIMDFLAGTREECLHRMSVREFLAAYGFAFERSETSLLEGEARAQQLWPCARAIVERVGSRNLVQLSDEERDPFRKQGGLLARAHFARTEDLLTHCLAPQFGFDPAAEVIGRVDKYQAEFLTGGYLEVFIWGLLRRHEEALGLSNVRLGVKPRIKGVSNDLDICFMHRHSLGVIECKSGEQGHDNNADPTLYKLEAVKHQFKALGVKSWIVTNSDVVKDGTGKIKSGLAARAALYGCRIVDGDPLRKLACTPDDAALLDSTLFASPPLEA